MKVSEEKLGREKLLGLYRTMVLIRQCEESLVEPILKGEIKTPCHLYSGEEAIAAGLCAVLDRNDYVFGNHRSHGHFIAKGGSLRELITEIYCRSDGCSRGRGGSMHVTDPQMGMMGSAPIVAGTISLALGAALAASIRKDGRVAVSFFGDGAAGEGVLYESMNFASLRRLPLIFACENNFYSTHLPIRECRARETIAEIAEPFGIEFHRVDGNDVLAVQAASQDAVDACRGGSGPVFLEFTTYRQRGHVGTDDNIQGSHTDIRPKEEVDCWLKKDPIARFEAFLLDSDVVTRTDLDVINAEVGEEVADAHRFAAESEAPPAREISEDVFA